MTTKIRMFGLIAFVLGVASWSMAEGPTVPEVPLVPNARLVSARLLTGPAFNVTSELRGGLLDGSSAVSSPTAYIQWESQRIGSLGPKTQSKQAGPGRAVPSFNLEGRLGFVDALTVLREAESEGSEMAAADGEATDDDAMMPGEAETGYKKAFAWDLGGRFSYSFRQTELAGVAKGGQTILLTDEELLQTNSGQRIVVPVANGVGRAAWYGELGVSLRLYNPPSEAAVDEIAAATAKATVSAGGVAAVTDAAKQSVEDKITASPVQARANAGSALTQAMEIAAGFRYDERFKKEGDLINLENPERRLFARFMLNGVQLFHSVTSTDGAPAKDNVYEIAFGVEYERGYGSGGARSATRIVLDLGADVIKLLGI